MQAIDEYREMVGQDDIIKEILEDAPELSHKEAIEKARKELEKARREAQEAAVAQKSYGEAVRDLTLQMEDLDRRAARANQPRRAARKRKTKCSVKPTCED